MASQIDYNNESYSGIEHSQSAQSILLTRPSFAYSWRPTKIADIIAHNGTVIKYHT